MGGKDKELGMKCLVTGAAGFIGSHVAECLLQEGHEVIALDDLSGGFTHNAPTGCIFIQGSITDAPLLASVFDGHKIDVVYHLAAYAAEGLSHFIRRFNYENNLIGSVNLINLSILHKVKCFVFTSSIAVYGKNQLPMTEDLVPQPEDPYGISKYAVELDLKAAHEMFGLNFVIFRPHNVYGERQNMADRYRNVIGIFMNQVMVGQSMTIFGDGQQTRAFSHISDVAPYIARSGLDATCYNEVFNVGSDDWNTVNDLAEYIAESFRVPKRVNYLPARNEVKDAYADHSKLGRFFACNKATSLRKGIELMAGWAKTLGPQKPSEFGAIEVPINLPPSWNLKK